MKNAIRNMGDSGYHYTRGFIFNLIAFAVVYKLFGFEWLIVVALADITRDLGILVMRSFDTQNPNSKDSINLKGKNENANELHLIYKDYRDFAEQFLKEQNK